MYGGLPFPARNLTTILNHAVLFGSIPVSQNDSNDETRRKTQRPVVHLATALPLNKA